MNFIKGTLIEGVGEEHHSLLDWKRYHCSQNGLKKTFKTLKSKGWWFRGCGGLFESTISPSQEV